MNNAPPRFQAAAYSFLFIGGLMFGQSNAAALTIDDFSQGGFSLQATNNSNAGGPTLVQTGLNPSFTLGGSRSVYIGSVSVSILSLASASVDTNKGRFNFASNAGYGYFELGWGTVTPLNANFLGGNNQFQINFADVTPGLSGGLFDLRVQIGNAWFRYDFSQDLFLALGGQTSGAVNIPFSKFGGANFSQVQAIELEASRVPTTFRLSIDSISVVPEPSATTLLGIVPLLAWLTSRKKLNR